MRLGCGDDPYRLSNLGGCVDRAALFGVSREDALALIARQRDVIDACFDELCDEARLTGIQRAAVRRVFPHEFALYDLAT
jgi:hypothetical protein